MTFSLDLPNAAQRHLQAAEMLNTQSGHRKDVAGYLYGISAECAIKHMIIPLRLGPEHDKKAIEYAHFPELRTRLRDALKGRQKTTDALFKFVFNDSFMNNWDIKMRYANARQIKDEWVAQWQEQARAAVGAMGT